MYAKPRPRGQNLRERAINLDDVELAGAGEQGKGERSASRADLDERLARAGRDGSERPFDDFRVVEKMLSQPRPPGHGSAVEPDTDEGVVP